MNRTLRRTRWKRHAGRSGSCSPSLPIQARRTRLLLPRSSRVWSASSRPPEANGTGPCFAPFGLRSRSGRTTDGVRRTTKRHGSSWLDSCCAPASALSGTTFVSTPCGGCTMAACVFPVGVSRARTTSSCAGWRAGSRANARPGLWQERSTGSAATGRPTNSCAWLDP